MAKNRNNGRDRPSGETGLTPMQERAAALLVAGKGLQETANELNIDRGTLYNWQRSIPFTAEYNRLRSELKGVVLGGLFDLHRQALDTLRKCLESENEALAFKAAVRIIDTVASARVGETDVRRMIADECLAKAEAKKEARDDIFSHEITDEFESYYESELERYGIDR